MRRTPLPRLTHPKRALVLAAVSVSCAAPGLVLGLTFLTRRLAAHRPVTVGVLLGILSVLVIALGLAGGVYALVQARSSGWRAVFSAAVLGLVLDVVFVLLLAGLAASSVRRARALRPSRFSAECEIGIPGRDRRPSVPGTVPTFGLPNPAPRAAP